MTEKSPEKVSEKSKEIPKKTDKSATLEIKCPPGLTKNQKYKDWVTIYSTNAEKTNWTNYKNYLPGIKAIFQDQLVPTDLIYLMHVESGGDTKLDGTKGPFQLKESTAEKWGLKVLPRIINERLDPFKAAKAAALELKDMHAKFKSWDWAMIGYHLGEYNAKKAYDKNHDINAYLKSGDTYLQRFYAARDVMKKIEINPTLTPQEAPLVYKPEYQNVEIYKVKPTDAGSLEKMFEKNGWGDHTTLRRLVAYNIKMNRGFNPNRLGEENTIYIPKLADLQIKFSEIPNATGIDQSILTKLNPHILSNGGLRETTIYFATPDQKERFYKAFSTYIRPYDEARNEDAVNTLSFVDTDNLLS